MKCQRCPIRTECSVWDLKQVDKNGNIGQLICPIVWVISQSLKKLPTEEEWGKPPSLQQHASQSGVIDEP